MARVCFTADFHLTDHQDDAYRFEIFPWLRKQIIHRKVNTLFILGDLTDRKDEHPATLVHRIADALIDLSTLCPIYILKGNHDYATEDNPFFAFLNNYSQRIHFVSQPKELKINGRKYLLLPHTRSSQFYPKWDLTKYDCILIHQAVKGAITANGTVMTGRLDRDRFYKVKRIIAGDIHVPQQVRRNVTYCGAPHPIKFGDEFQPRVLLEENGELRSIDRHTLKKAIVTITDASQLRESGLCEGDRVQVIYRLLRSEFVYWDNHRREVEAEAERLGIKLWGIKLAAIEGEVSMTNEGRATNGRLDVMGTFKQFCRLRGIDGELRKAGKELLNG